MAGSLRGRVRSEGRPRDRRPRPRAGAGRVRARSSRRRVGPSRLDLAGRCSWPSQALARGRAVERLAQRARAGDGRPRSAARRPSPTAPCAACARRGRSRPWSTPYRWPSVIASTCPPLRSALFTTTSKTAIRRSGAVSSCTSETGWSRPSRPSKTWRQPVGHVALADQRDGLLLRVRLLPAAAPCPGRAGPSRSTGLAARRPSRAPRRPGTPPPRGRRACRRGSPTAAAPPRSACRRPDAVDLAHEGRVGRRHDPAVQDAAHRSSRLWSHRSRTLSGSRRRNPLARTQR